LWQRVSALLLAGMVSGAAAATGQSLPLYFLKLAGIKGDSTVAGHENEAEINACSFDIRNAISQSGGGSSIGRPVFGDILVTKRQDSVTPQLFLTIAGGKHLSEVTITARNSDGKMEDYLSVKLTRCL
jgi:type VI secretion system Hcp family effector